MFLKKYNAMVRHASQLHRGEEMFVPETPIWACPQYGNYEHDWMDCPECCDQYEQLLDCEEERHASDTQIQWPRAFRPIPRYDWKEGF